MGDKVNHSTEASTAELHARYEHHPPTTDERVCAHEGVRRDTLYLARLFDQNLPPGRYKALAQTALEEAAMWANKAIATGAE